MVGRLLLSSTYIWYLPAAAWSQGSSLGTCGRAESQGQDWGQVFGVRVSGSRHHWCRSTLECLQCRYHATLNVVVGVRAMS